MSLRMAEAKNWDVAEGGGGRAIPRVIKFRLTHCPAFVFYPSTRREAARDKAAKYARIWEIPFSPAHNAIFAVIRLYIG